MKAARFLACLLPAMLLAGCGGGSKSTAPPPSAPDPLPSNTVLNDTPAHAMQRFEATFEYESNQSYAALLSSDFHFIFSADTDPNLVQLYGPNWSALDESLAVAHLFHGFTNTYGSYVAGASAITMALAGATEVGDSTHADSLDVYRVVRVASVLCDLAMPVDGGVVYSISSPQKFYVVRGDAAVLRPGQPATADRWYIRRWEDLAVPLLDGKRRAEGNAALARTFGETKAAYR